MRDNEEQNSQSKGMKIRLCKGNNRRLPGRGGALRSAAPGDGSTDRAKPAAVSCRICQSQKGLESCKQAGPAGQPRGQQGPQLLGRAWGASGGAEGMRR